VLCQLQRTKRPIKPLLDTVIEECRLAENERALAMNLAYGVLRRRDCLALLIGRLCRHPLNRLEPFVYHALEVGLFQLFFLDRIPASAAVNETVNALKSSRLPRRLQGFVNGILRESIRQGSVLAELFTAPPSGGACLNHPPWLTERWRRHYGEAEMRRICARNNLEPLLVLRVNTARVTKEAFCLRLSDQGIAWRHGRFAPEAVVLPDYQGAIPRLPGYEEGCFLVQDEATQLATLLLGPFLPQGSYLDACAGLGGKTSHLAVLAPGLGLHLFAVEPDARRYLKLAENLGRLFPGHSCTMKQSTLAEFARDCRTSFHGILIDAPCSGTGVTGRHPDIRWNREETDLLRYQAEQLDLLEQAAGLVRKSGVLVYATCSLEPEENQEVVRRFLERNREFHLSDPTPCLPAAACRFVENLLFCPRPEETIDGFFAARLVRQ
jgi:16S rRNA (cytosine967-C5)-methyltransferase